MRHAITAIVFALTFTGIAGADILAPAKAEYGFEAWPGKAGALKQGVALWDVDLSAYEVHSTRHRLPSTGEMVVRFAEKNGTKPVFEVGVRVFDSVAEAQTFLLEALNASTLHLPLAKALGLDVGDVAFATMRGEVVDTALFTRNNVYVRVALVGQPKGSSLGPVVSTTARKIDEIVEVEEQTKKAKGLKKPRIVKFSAAQPVARPMTPVAIDLQVTDPRGDKVEYHFDEAGGYVWQDKGAWWFQAEIPSDYTVTLFAVNEHFLQSRKTLTIRIEK
jgi:hypothetical protein